VIIANGLFALVSSMFTAYLAYLIVKLNKQSESMAKNIEKVEKATNSMKDALVLATEKEALARGTKEGHAAGVKDEKARH
jgi:hypothetical protein